MGRGPDTQALAPGSLRRRVVMQTSRAQQLGALHAIATSSEYVVDRGVRFLVRMLGDVARKDAARRAQMQTAAHAAGDADPFLPPEQALVVGSVSDTHLCVLNKFNVVRDHLLIVTRAFEHQQTLLTLADFEALWRCMAEYPSLGFYNAGVIAGASQPHKHLQLVPLPLASRGPSVPMAPLLDAGGAATTPVVVPGLPYAHLLAQVAGFSRNAVRHVAEATHIQYLAMIDAAGLLEAEDADGVPLTAPYNLLATRRWMLLVPRSAEAFGGISVNALGFAGAMLVRDSGQMGLLRRHGPMRVLEHVARPVQRS